MSFADSYLGGLRALVGNRPLLVVGARVLIEDDRGRFLIVRRTDDGKWGLPGGAMELGESLMEVVHREVREEANVILKDVTAFGLSSDPAIERHVYPNGDVVQSISLLAHACIMSGSGEPDGDETSEVRFSSLDEIEEVDFCLPEYPTFKHWAAFQKSGRFLLV